MFYTLEQDLEAKKQELERKMVREADAAKRFELSLQLFAIEERLARIGS